MFYDIIDTVRRKDDFTMIYIDFDGVILDTEELLFEKWHEEVCTPSSTEEDKIRYMQQMDWEYILYHSDAICDSIYYLQNMDPSTTTILTKIHSLENEGGAKVKWIRDNHIKQNIILVPYFLKKSDVVDAKDNILVDDCLKNLDDFTAAQGKGIFFDNDNDDYDSWHQPNTKGYQKVLNLSSFSKK